MIRLTNISTPLLTGIFILLLNIAPVENTLAQQDAVYSQYMNNIISVNPSYSGIRGVGSASTIVRKQWLNLEGSPMTSSMNLSLPVDSLHFGAGFDFMYDDIGPTSTTSLFLNYSYRIKASPQTHISFGLKAGFNYLQANLTELDRYDYDDSYILEYGDFSRFMPNFGVGILWYNEHFYAGLSVPRLLQNSYNDQTNSIEAASREERHYFINGAYLFDLSPKMVLKPSLTTIMVAGSPITADFDLSILYSNQFRLGATYRISDAVGAYAQVQIDRFKVGFAYDYSHTRLKEFNNGTYEVMLRIDFKTTPVRVFPF
jgi:type IX secretion system PorP/SprF family membrane protein